METPQRQQVLENPSLEEAIKAIKAGISRHRTVIIAGNCTVEYDGRASSKLEQGERVILFKGDGSALVHRPKDYSPVNWQPAGSLFRTILTQDGLKIRVFRRKENETMEVIFTDLAMVAVLDLVDFGEFSLYATERDMQEAILFKPELLEPGFRPITKEKAVDPGFIDILGVDKDNKLTVVEIKRVKANKDAVNQLKKYMDVIDLDKGRPVRAILVAPELGKGVEKLLKEYGYEYKLISPQKCSEVLKQKKGKPLTSFFG
ncbi:MAG: endonuclease NucS [Candidatus Bathyarchaeota archaeon]|nr:endonuclease NucS [Candidatus Bathyarchaeota archaeon]